MNREEAKNILQSCRSNGQDANDPQFAEALAYLRQDAELAKWFAEQQKFDAAIGKKLKAVEIPLDLKAKILSIEIPSPQKIVGFPETPWWQKLFSLRSPASWALGAAVIVLCLVTFAQFRPGQTGKMLFADYEKQMVHAAQYDSDHVDAHISDMKQLVAWLGEHHGESQFTLPAALDAKNGLMGCRAMEWHGQKVSMLCYGLKGAGHVDLFVVSAKAFSDAPSATPQFASEDDSQVAMWSDSGKAYLMIAEDKGTDLHQVLQAKTVAQIHLQNGRKIFVE